MYSRVLDLRKPSLVRGTVLVMASLVTAFLMAGWPDDRPSLELLIPTLVAFAGTWDTVRCLHGRWNLYNGGVIILIYTEIMAISMILFLFLYPYGQWIM